MVGRDGVVASGNRKSNILTNFSLSLMFAVFYGRARKVFITLGLRCQLSPII